MNDITQRDLERMTDRELDIVRSAVEAERVRRYRVREAQRAEAARNLVMRARLDADLHASSGLPVAHGTTTLIAPLRPVGAGGLVVAIDRERGVRIVACGSCPETFEHRLTRGRAPRTCPDCKAARR